MVYNIVKLAFMWHIYESNHLKFYFYSCLQVGKNVTDIAVGDNVGVGTLSDSCLDCRECLQVK